MATESQLCKKQKLSNDVSSNLPGTNTEKVASILVADDKSVSESDGLGHSALENDNALYNRCQFFIKKKRRNCKTQAPSGKSYCAEHSHVAGDSSDRKRICCPLDPRHTCYEDQLLNHMKKCNSRPELQPKCFQKDINKGDGEDRMEKVSLKDVSDEEIFGLIDRIKKFHKEYVSISEREELFHPVLQTLADKPSSGVAAQKHITQQASLIGHMEKANLLENDTSFVEFGAGKGGLSHWVQLAVAEASNTHFLLVDKGSVRYKMDTFHKGEDQGPSFERLKIDIAHLNLSEVESLQSGRRIVGLGKHLCGGATDLMLRCLVETLVKSKMDSCHLAGIVLAVCCHHRCDWRSYVGKEFMTSLGVTPHDFHLMTRLTSWAVCGTRPTQDRDGEAEAGSPVDENDAAVDAADATEYNHTRYKQLSHGERADIGFLCKDLINEGRRKYLEMNGVASRMVAYIDRGRTLENMAILASCYNPRS